MQDHCLPLCGRQLLQCGFYRQGDRCHIFKRGSRIGSVEHGIFRLNDFLSKAKVVHALVMRDRKQPAVKFPPRRIAADALHHCDKNILRQVISVLLMPGQFENISVNSRIPAANQKLQCALISAFDPVHQFAIAIFHCLTAFSVSITNESTQRDERYFIKIITGPCVCFPTAIFKRFYILTPERKKLRIKNQRICFIWSSRKKQPPCKS